MENTQKKVGINFPSGNVGYELLYYMGVDFKEEKSTESQRLIDKCQSINPISLNKNELELLKREVDNAIDLKADHVGYEGWNALQQHHLSNFSEKLYKAIQKVTD